MIVLLSFIYIKNKQNERQSDKVTKRLRDITKNPIPFSSNQLKRVNKLNCSSPFVEKNRTFLNSEITVLEGFYDC